MGEIIIDAREQKINEIPLKVWVEDVVEEWNELSTENNNIETIVSILEDENFNWIKLNKKNKTAFYNKLIELVEQTDLTLNKEEVLAKLKKTKRIKTNNERKK